MARLLGVNIPDNKRIEIALTYIFGVGKLTSSKILSQANIDKNTLTKELKNSELERIREIIGKNYKVEGDLKILTAQNIKRLKEINSYRGSRHIKKLPVRGQRTKTNARTKRGRRICVGSGKKKVEKT